MKIVMLALFVSLNLQADSGFSYGCDQTVTLYSFSPIQGIKRLDQFGPQRGEGFATDDAMADLKNKIQLAKKTCEDRSAKMKSYTICIKSKINCGYIGPDLNWDEINYH